MFLTRKTLAVTAVLSVALLATACATKPKYAPGPQTKPQASETYGGATRGPSDQGVTAQSNAPLPGSAQDFEANAGDRVYFDYDQYAVRPDAAPVLAAQAAWLKHYPSVHVRIEGNADERGTREYNFALGASRANAVRDYLVNHGVEASRIEVVSYGKERPIDTSESDAGMAKNRNGHTAITGGAR
ncbi:MAG TPA: peptidoglycan-associated lipoprotein Pal [Caulobacteraceae bacterium]|jgi:peptidoglycan-associated lipoprotein